LVVGGLLLARYSPAIPSHWWFICAALSAAVALFTRDWVCRIALAVAVIAVSGGWFTLRALERPADDIARRLTPDQRLISVEGMVIDAPLLRTERSGRLGEFLPTFEPSTMIRLSVERLRSPQGLVRSSGELLVFIGAEVRRLEAGDRIALTGMARAVEPATNPGEPDRLLWARATGVSGSMRVESQELITPATTEPSTLQTAAGVWRRSAAAIRARASAWLTDDDASPDSQGAISLLRALFLGQRDESLREIGGAFERLGLAHVLAISGLHLALMGWVMRQIVRAPGARPWVESLIVVALVCAYLVVIPVRAPVFRAAITIIGFLIADASGRRYDRLTTLGWVFVVTLAWQPMELWSPGFQLSFGVVAALLTLTDPLRNKLFGPPPHRDHIGSIRAALEGVKDALAASICAWAVATPLVAYHMGVFSPLGAPITVLLMPLIFVVMCAGYLAMLASTLIPGAADWTTPVVVALAKLVEHSAVSLDSIPGAAIYLPALSIPFTLVALAAVIWWLAPMRFDAPLWRLRARWCASAIVALWFGAACSWTGLPRGVALRIDTIDVGDGSCHLIRSGADAMLYDCGSLRLSMGEREIPRALRALDAWRIHTIVISHPNLDHYAAFPDIARRFGVRRAFVSRAVLLAAERSPDGPVADTLNRLRDAGVAIHAAAAGDSWTLGNATIDVLSPPPDGAWKFDNDASLVLLVQAPNDASASAPAGAPSKHRLLLCGDIQRQGMVWTLTRAPGLRADILEAPHHGSAHAAAFDFVADIAPSIVIQSSGESRLEDPRWKSTRDGLHWWSTPAHGAITVICGLDGSRRVTHWMRPPRRPPPDVSCSYQP
jgi:competence protein ComEC